MYIISAGTCTCGSQIETLDVFLTLSWSYFLKHTVSHWIWSSCQAFCIDAGIQTLGSHTFKPCPQSKNLLYNWANLYPGVSLTVQVLLYKIFMQWEIKSSQRNCFPFMCLPLWIVSHLDEIFYKQRRKIRTFSTKLLLPGDRLKLLSDFPFLCPCCLATKKSLWAIHLTNRNHRVQPGCVCACMHMVLGADLRILHIVSIALQLWVPSSEQ